MGYLKGKSELVVYDKSANLMCKYGSREYAEPFTGNKNKRTKRKQPRESGCLKW